MSRGIVPRGRNGQKRLLELGGGRGYLQQAAAEIGWITTGLELSAHGVREAVQQDLRVLPSTLEHFSRAYLPRPAYFDVVALFDFIEHVDDPGVVLRTVARLLTPDGVAILRTPIIRGTPRLHLVDHIWHFTRRTIRLWLEREGFAVEREAFSGTFESIDGRRRLGNWTVFARRRV